MNPSGVQVNDADWPVLLIDVSLPPSVAVGKQIRAALDRGVARHERFGAALILRVARIPSPALLRDQARWFSQRGGDLRGQCAGIAIVTTSAAMRGIPNALGRVAPLPMPLRAFKILDDARDWLNIELARNTIHTSA